MASAFLSAMTCADMFLATTSDFFITLMAYSLDAEEDFFLQPRKTFPKAPLEMGLRIWKSSMVGAKATRLDVEDEAEECDSKRRRGGEDEVDVEAITPVADGQQQ